METLAEYQSFMQEQQEGLKIRLWEHPALVTVSEPYTADEFGPELEALGKDMLQLIQFRGLGLAANQVGITKRLYVLNFEAQRGEFEQYICVNPVIENSGRKSMRMDGCLSMPGLFEQTERYAETFLQYQDALTGERRSLALEGLQAHAAQHEQDHIDGIMFFTKVPKNPRKRMMAQWEKERRRALDRGLGV